MPPTWTEAMRGRAALVKHASTASHPDAEDAAWFSLQLHHHQRLGLLMSSVLMDGGDLTDDVKEQALVSAVMSRGLFHWSNEPDDLWVQRDILAPAPDDSEVYVPSPVMFGVRQSDRATETLGLFSQGIAHLQRALVVQDDKQRALALLNAVASLKRGIVVFRKPTMAMKFYASMRLHKCATQMMTINMDLEIGGVSMRQLCRATCHEALVQMRSVDGQVSLLMDELLQAEKATCTMLLQLGAVTSAWQAFGFYYLRAENFGRALDCANRGLETAGDCSYYKVKLHYIAAIAAHMSGLMSGRVLYAALAVVIGPRMEEARKYWKLCKGWMPQHITPPVPLSSADLDAAQRREWRDTMRNFSLTEHEALVMIWASPVFTFNQKKCDKCGEYSNFLFKCKACRNARYCGAACQHAAWPQHRHNCHPVNTTSVNT